MKMNNENLNLNRISEFVNFCKTYPAITQNSTQKSELSAIEIFKKGRKIKIKKENVGSFTRYCGGNVTTECISKGKNSPDPKIRKKATFAANSRLWSKK